MVNSFVCDFHSNLFFESRNKVESDGRMCKIKSNSAFFINWKTCRHLSLISLWRNSRVFISGTFCTILLHA